MTSRLTLLIKQIVEGDVENNRRTVVYENINHMLGIANNRGICPHTLLGTGVNCNGCAFTSIQRIERVLKLVDTYE